MPKIQISVDPKVLVAAFEPLREEWNHDDGSFLRWIAVHIEGMNQDYNPMAGAGRKIDSYGYDKLLVSVGSRVGLMKARGGTFDDFVASLSDIDGIGRLLLTV